MREVEVLVLLVVMLVATMAREPLHQFNFKATDGRLPSYGYIEAYSDTEELVPDFKDQSPNGQDYTGGFGGLGTFDGLDEYDYPKDRAQVTHSGFRHSEATNEVHQ